MQNQQGSMRLARDVGATKRFYEFTGNVSRLGGSPRLIDAREMADWHLYWGRLASIR